MNTDTAFDRHLLSSKNVMSLTSQCSWVGSWKRRGYGLLSAPQMMHEEGQRTCRPISPDAEVPQQSRPSEPAGEELDHGFFLSILTLIVLAGKPGGRLSAMGTLNNWAQRSRFLTTHSPLSIAKHSEFTSQSERLWPDFWSEVVACSGKPHVHPGENVLEETGEGNTDEGRHEVDQYRCWS